MILVNQKSILMLSLYNIMLRFPIVLVLEEWRTQFPKKTGKRSSDYTENVSKEPSNWLKVRPLRVLLPVILLV